MTDKTGILNTEVLAQLFVYGPVWDGNIICKSERDALFETGHIERYEGWNFLTEKGVKAALQADWKHWQWQKSYRKQQNLD